MQIINHVDRAGVVPDHKLQEQAIKGSAVGRSKLCHLSRCCHAHHIMVPVVHRMITTAMCHLHRQRLTAISEPAGHEFHLVLLARIDPASECNYILIVGSAFDEICHFDRLSVVHDHALHEVDICGRVSCACQLARLFNAKNGVCFAWRARLHNRDFLRKYCRGTARHQDCNNGLHACG